MVNATEFLLDVSLISPDLTERNELKLKVVFAKSNSGYGNDTYMRVNGRDGNSFEQLYDIRYDKNFSSKRPEVYIANWAYNYWSGENGAWSITGISIKAQGVRKGQSK
jgi:hypothetical protein